ncbi:hypothetical protein QFZ37_000045 [Chryseobacterium ginsenosidimutans]|uniref:hypothetical protein n=1 Tax=Chryseobacterium ginsenosidimutans TaxID=687846 RepID=UPI0027801E1C|nr:hypothetical protein [Chryseobacterium ginsenosidimutans]MDQ0591676.1 hypothetical protein [Chryseobacterium ginsenosidimutans]
MKKIKFSKEGKITFYLSFIIGTALLTGYAVSNSDFFVVMGIYYVLIVAVVNMLVFFHELIFFLSNISDNEAHGNSTLLLLLNIPVTILYIFIVLQIAHF